MNHGIELHPNIVEFARARVFDFLIRPEVQCYDWAIPSYSSGNGLMLHPIYNCKYDRVYCGASVPESHRESLWDLLKVGGVLVMPFDDQVIMMLFALVVHFKYSFIFLLTVHHRVTSLMMWYKSRNTELMQSCEVYLHDECIGFTLMIKYR